MPFDGVTYVRCTECGCFIVEGEAEAHEHHCSGSKQGPDEAGDNREFLGCLTGTVMFGPGWDRPLPAGDWETLG
jgi:hypothetical protein